MSNGWPPKNRKTKNSNKLFQKQKYTTTRVRNRKPKLKSGEGIIDRVKGAIVQKKLEREIGRDLAAIANEKPTSKTPLSKKEFQDKYGPGLHTAMESMKKPKPKKTDPPPRTVTSEDGSNLPLARGSDFLNKFFDGTYTQKGERGSYVDGQFVADPSGKLFNRYYDDAGNPVQASFSPTIGGFTGKDKAALLSMSEREKTLSKDPYGNNITNLDKMTQRLAASRGINRQSDEYRKFRDQFQQDAGNMNLGRSMHDKSYNFSAEMGEIGPDRVSEGFEWGTGSPTDLSRRDLELGGLGTPYTRISANQISRQGRYVPTVNAKGVVTGSTWETAGTVDKDDPSLKDNPYQAYYWTNPELGGKAIVPGTTTRGKTFSGPDKTKSLDKEQRQEVIDAQNKAMRDEFYSSDFYGDFKEKYPELQYDYDAPDPWTMQQGGEITQPFRFWN